MIQKSILSSFIALLAKAYPHTKGDHNDWDEWAQASLKAPDKLSSITNVFAKSKGFLNCIERFSDLRTPENKIYDPRWQKARYRVDIAAIAMIIVHGEPQNTVIAIDNLSKEIDTLFK